jgi:hypothetical protein
MQFLETVHGFINVQYVVRLVRADDSSWTVYFLHGGTLIQSSASAEAVGALASISGTTAEVGG